METSWLFAPVLISERLGAIVWYSNVFCLLPYPYWLGVTAPPRRDILSTTREKQLHSQRSATKMNRDPQRAEAIHHERSLRVICIGAGPSGLCLAYKLQRSFRNFALTVCSISWLVINFAVKDSVVLMIEVLDLWEKYLYRRYMAWE